MTLLAKPALDLGIVVRDLDRSLEFYRDTLGLPLRSTMQVRGVGQLALVEVGSSTLKLVQPGRPTEHVPAPGGVRGGALGMRYLTLTVVSVDDVVARCVAAGARLAMEPTRMAPTVLVAAVEDPDSNWVELMQIDGT